MLKKELEILIENKKTKKIDIDFDYLKVCLKINISSLIGTNIL